MSNKEDSILYSPNLQYDKSYYTEGAKKNNYEEKNDNDIKDESISKLDEIKDLTNRIDSNLALLPDYIKDAYLPPYIEMNKESNKIYDEIKHKDNDDDNKDKNKGDNEHYIPGEPEPEDKDYYPEDPFQKGEDVYVEFEDPYADYSKVVNNRYYTNFLDIYADYLNKLYKVTNDFILDLIDATINNPLRDNPLQYKTTKIKNKDLWHLTDFLCKSSIYLDQQIRLHKKFFDIDESVLHIRQLKMAKEQSARYYKINELQEKNKYDMLSNLTLQESRYVADKKYKENLKHLYKYLNSSVILLDESLNMLKKQAQSMTTINKYEKRD